ncbi:MAG: tetratricopeptide repeat protein [Elusimicrobia bacterium]|nr:tetratricopeptide repeat protein [Elusimicrobiota bacterium]
MTRKHKDIRTIEAAGVLSGDAFLNSYKPFVWIFFVGFLLYFRTIFFNFSYLDDNALILDKFDFISRASNIINFFREEVFHSHLGGSYYRPMITVSFMLDALWGGKNPGAYHFTNVLLHLFVCCLVFRVLVKLNYNRALSFFYALLFTVHPVLTQAVAWIPGRNDILLALFTLLSFISFLSFLEGRKRAQLAAHLLFLLLALLTKENAVFLCALCLFFVVFIKKESEPAAGGNLSLFAGWILVVSGWFLARSAVLKTIIGNSDFNIIRSLMENSPALIPYIGKIFFPFDLGIMPVLKDLPMRYGVCAGIITGALIYVSRAKRANYVAFGIFWFLLFLLPSFIRSGSAVPDFSEHRLYLPLTGFIFMLAELDIPGILKLRGRGALALGAGVLCLFFLIAFIHCGNFRDKISFWKKAVESSPSYAFSYNNLGSMYYLDGDLPNAESLWKKAVSVNPEEKLVYGNLGLLYMNRGKFKEAEEYYLKEIKLNPLYDNVYLNLGILYYGGGFVDKAELSWEMALRINPDFAKVYANLAFLNYQKKDITKAKFYIEQMRNRGFYVQPELEQVIAASK